VEDERTAVPVAATAAARLVERIRAGDREAEGELCATYQRGVLVIAAARTRDREAARDLAQDIFIAVLKALREGQLRDPDRLAGFIQGTARNLINNYLRKRGTRGEVELPVDDNLMANPVEGFESAERRRLIAVALESFSIIDQQILLLSLVEGYPLADVALKLSLSHEAVRARKSRMLRKITKKFARLSQKQNS
jgi:RNA polymerase sigma-70 factor (ECF subfamily)